MPKPTLERQTKLTKQTRRLPANRSTETQTYLERLAAQGYPRLPAHLHLRDQDVPYWSDILRARARDEWGRAELPIVVQLARCQADIETGYNLLDTHDKKKVEEEGYPSMRAVSQHINSLIAQQRSLMCLLRIAGTIVGDPELEVPRRKAEREAEQTLKRAQMVAQGQDDFLAMA